MQKKPKKDYLKEWKKRTIWRRIVACLALVVALSTGYVLILPAVTMEQQTAAESSKETEADWEETLPEQLTGTWGTDLAAVARSQLGYAESSTDTAVNDKGESSGYTRYGAWYGDEYGDWNGMFLAFCLHYAKISEDAVKAGADTAQILRFAQEKGFYKETGQYEPEIGDIAFLPDGQVGIVTAVSQEGVSVTAGDVDGKVAVLEKSEPLGYGSMTAADSLYKENDTDSVKTEENKTEEEKSEENKTDLQESEVSAGTVDQEDEEKTEENSSAASQTVQNPDAASESTDSGSAEQQDTAEETEGISENTEQDLKDYVLNETGYGGEEPSFTEKMLNANGDEVEQQDGKYPIYEGEPYTWIVSFYAPTGITEAGTYVYEMPAGIAALPETYDVVADDGTVIGTLSVDDDGKTVRLQVQENTKIRLRVGLKLALDVQKMDAAIEHSIISFEPKPEEGNVEKTYSINSEGKIEWCITVRIPGSKNGVYGKWYIVDTRSDLLAEGIPDGNVTITYAGKTQVLHSIDKAGDDDQIAYYVEEDKYGSGVCLYFVSRNTEDQTGSTPSVEEGSTGLGSDWSLDWKLQDDSVITIKYLDPYFDIGTVGTLIQNTASLYYNDHYVMSDDVKLLFPSLVEKADMSGRNFLITVNPKGNKEDTDNEGKLLDLSGMGPVEIHDEMSKGMLYQLGSMVITAVDEDGIETTLVQDTDYTLDVSKNGDGCQVMDIELLHPGKFEYRILYGVVLESGQTGSSYENEVTVSILGKEFTADASKQFFTSTAEEYVLSISKTDQDYPMLAVPGATYGIFSSQGELMATAVTDNNGTAQFKGNPSGGFILSNDMLYYLEETEAPEGYQVSQTRYWFYYSDSDPQKMDNLISAAKLEGFFRESDVLAEPVVNKGYTDKKVDGFDVTAKPIPVKDQRVWYELPETGSTGTRMYTIAGLLLTGSAVTALYREKIKKWRKKR